MPRVHFHRRYETAYRKFTRRNPQRVRAIDKALRLFAQDPYHESLHTEKLSGSDVWAVRINKGDRLFFVWADDGDTAIFFAVGLHDMYRKI